jgi:GT2 family glycosyltransferase
MTEKVGLIVINFLGSKDTGELLESLDKIKEVDRIKVYLIQYGTDCDIKNLDDHNYPVQLIFSADNLGFAGMNNLGLKEALKDGMDYLILLNNDTTVDENFLAPLISSLKDDEVGIVSPMIYFYPGCEFHKDSYTKKEQGKVIWYGGGVIDWQNMMIFHKYVDELDRGQLDHNALTDFATGCCMAMRASLLDKIGLMPDKYFMYLEDVDWCMMAKKNGFQIKVIEESKIFHKNASSTGGSGSEMHEYYQTRNRIIFTMKHAPTTSKIAVVRQALGDWRNGRSATLREASYDGLRGRTGQRRNN